MLLYKSGMCPIMQIIVQNLAAEYQDDGTGDVIFFLHGWQDNLHTFDALASFLSPAHRVIRLDLPGFGKSEAPKEPWGLDDYVRFVKNFIQKLNINVDILVGHSFGARIVIKGAATKNLQPRKIILMGAAGIAKSRTLRNFVFKVFAKIGGLVTYIPPLVFWREKLRTQMYRFVGSDYLNAGALKETFLKIISEDISTCAQEITIPTLLIWGAGDTETQLSDGEQLSRLIRHSQLKVVRGAGHFVHREKVRDVATLLQEFL